MSNFSRLLATLTFLLTSVEVSAEMKASSNTETIDCGSVVSQTVTEMRVGAEAWWSDDVEKMVGMAAMSACFKVLSAHATNASNDAEGTASKASAKGDATAQSDASSSLSFRPLSGSASKKPYERARARKDPK